MVRRAASSSVWTSSRSRRIVDGFVDRDATPLSDPRPPTRCIRVAVPNGDHLSQRLRFDEKDEEREPLNELASYDSAREPNDGRRNELAAMLDSSQDEMHSVEELAPQPRTTVVVTFNRGEELSPRDRIDFVGPHRRCARFAASIALTSAAICSLLNPSPACSTA